MIDVIYLKYANLKSENRDYENIRFQNPKIDLDLCCFAISDRKTCKNWSRVDGIFYDMSKIRKSLLKI